MHDQRAGDIFTCERGQHQMHVFELVLMLPSSDSIFYGSRMLQSKQIEKD